MLRPAMPLIPAYCPACHAVFPSPIYMEPGARNVSVKNVNVSCPRCGAIGYIPDGVYSAIGEAAFLLARLRPSLPDIKTLAQILRQARAKESRPEAVAAEIKDKVPELSGISSYFPKTRIEFYTFLTLLIAIVALYVNRPAPAQEPLSKEQVQEMVNQAVIDATGEKAQPGQPPPLDKRKRGKPGRNEPCPCGSGKKYKKCCLNSPGGAGR